MADRQLLRGWHDPVEGIFEIRSKDRDAIVLLNVLDDAVFRKILGKPNFTWVEHGEALLRRRKPWYYEREPDPGITVIGARLSELAARR